MSHDKDVRALESNSLKREFSVKRIDLEEALAMRLFFALVKRPSVDDHFNQTNLATTKLPLGDKKYKFIAAHLAGMSF